MGWFIASVILQMAFWFVIWKSAVKNSNMSMKKKLGVFLFLYMLADLCMDLGILLMYVFHIQMYPLMQYISDTALVISLLFLLPSIMFIVMIVQYMRNKRTRRLKYFMTKPWFQTLSVVAPMIALISGTIGFTTSFALRM